MENIVSGIRPTGKLHLGSYFGAVRNFIEMQNNFNCFFFIADYHALTTHPNAKSLKDHKKHIIAEYLAAGLNPNNCIIYSQSSVPEVTELYLLLNMNAYLGELERCPSFKDKVRKQPNNVNAGLLTYPVLMTADILIHKATKVPVGKDQAQHLELSRDFAERFNKLYEYDYFPLPEAFTITEDLIKIPSLSGNGKMGKSEDEKYTIFLTDLPENITKKIKQAPTDSGPSTPNAEKPASIEALFQIMHAVSSRDTYEYFNNLYLDCTIRYKDFKEQLAKDIINLVTPIQEKFKEYLNNETYLSKVLDEGAEKARESAKKTLYGAKQLVGLI